MRVIGIIAEYNPFHKGHAYMLKEVRRKFPDAAILAVMSGSFTQRGEAAILDKWQRAQMAVQGGCNLVLELPFAFAVIRPEVLMLATFFPLQVNVGVFPELTVALS